MDNIKADVVELTGDVLLRKQHSVQASPPWAKPNRTTLRAVEHQNY